MTVLSHYKVPGSVKPTNYVNLKWVGDMKCQEVTFSVGG